MSAFTGPLAVQYGEGGGYRLAVLLEPLPWHCDFKGSEAVVIVPPGFESDGASVPRPLWWFLPPWGDRSTRAAILHDFVCEELIAGRPQPGCDTRERCDRQFHLALLALGVAEWRAWLAWAGVRAYSITSGNG